MMDDNKIRDDMVKILSDLRNSTRKESQDYHLTYHLECLKHVQREGLWMEFGVYRGRSLCNFADNNNKQVIFGFDSFEGLPEFWDKENPKGVYSLAGRLPDGAITGNNDDNPGMYSSAPTKTTRPWPVNTILVKGLFQDTLPGFLQEYTENSAFIHLDCDLYGSSKYVLDTLSERIQPGTLLLLDDIISDVDYPNNQLRAVAEFFDHRDDITYEAKVCQDFGLRYVQGCLLITEKVKI